MVVTSVLVDAAVVLSAAAALAITPRMTGRQAEDPAEAPRPDRRIGPGVALVAVPALIYLNQVLFTVYVLRVHGGSPSFIARYLPAGWFALADGNPFIQWLAVHFPAPGLLAPSVLRVQAFLELPFVLLAYVTVLRHLDVDLYRRVACSALIWLAAASYTTVFCTVEWSLHNPHTVQDIVIRLLSATVTPALIAAMARREHRQPAGSRPLSASGLLLFGVSLWALGHLVLVVYDTALLYNLGHLGTQLPGAVLALAVLIAVRVIAARHAERPAPAAAGPALTTVADGLRRSLALFFVPALAVRYGVTFGSPLLAAGTGLLIATVAGAHAVREGLASRQRAGLPLWPFALTTRLAVAAGVGLAAAYAAVRWTGDTYYEAALLRAAAVFLITTIATCALTDAAVPAPHK